MFGFSAFYFFFRNRVSNFFNLFFFFKYLFGWKIHSDCILFVCRRVLYSDLNNIAPEHYTKQITTRLTDIKAVTSPDDRSIFIQILESSYRFGLGAVAGGRIIYNIWSYIVSDTFISIYIYSVRCNCCLSY